MNEVKKIVNAVLCKESRKEAMDILTLSSEDDVQKFIKYYKEDNYNVCCLHLDFLKDKLVEKGLMKDEGCFGHPFGNLLGLS